jgi:hypothetical protein
MATSYPILERSFRGRKGALGHAEDNLVIQLTCVTTAEKAADPRDVALTVYPIGSAFIFPSSGLVLFEAEFDHSYVLKKDVHTHLINLLYRQRIWIPNLEWSISTRGALESDRVFVDADGVPIGPHQYIPVTKYTQQVDDNTLPDCVRREVDVGTQYKARDHNGCELFLYRIGSAKSRRGLGIEVTRATVQYTFSIITTQTPNDVANLSTDYVDTLNDATFYGRPKGTMRCVEVAIDQTPGIAEGLPATGFVYNVAVTFLYQPNGWFRRFYDTWDEEGTESIVQGPHPERRGFFTDIYTDYRPHRYADFDALLNLFAQTRNLQRSKDKK